MCTEQVSLLLQYVTCERWLGHSVHPVQCFSFSCHSSLLGVFTLAVTEGSPLPGD